MSLEAMKTLSAVEEQLRLKRTDAAAAAKKALADAGEQGEALVAEALKKAGEEVSELTRKTEEKAKADAAALADESRDAREALRAQAKKREEEAVSFVVDALKGS